MTDRTTGEVRRRRIAIPAIVLCGLLLITGIVAATALMIGNFRDSELMGGLRELDNAALLLSRHFDEQFEDFADAQARLTTRLGAAEIDSPTEFSERMSTFAVHQLLEAEVDTSFGVNDIRLYSADGDIINTSKSGPIKTASIADQSYFKSFKSNSTPATTLAAPLRSRSLDRWTVVLARKLVNSDGVFLGVMTRRIDPSRFEKFFGSIVFREGVQISLVHRDGSLLAHFPEIDDSTAAKTLRTADFLKLVATSDHGSAEMRDLPDHVVRLASARQMRNFPIVVVATMPTAEALDAWRGQTNLLVIVAGLLTFVMVTIFLAIGRSWSRERRQTEAWLAAGKQRLDTALTNMTQGLCLFDAKQRLVVSNSRFREMYKLLDDQVRPGAPFSAIAEGLAMSEDAFAMSAPESGAGGDRVRRLRDGRVILIRRSATPDGGWVATHEDITDRERVASELAARLTEQVRIQKKLEAQKSELIATTEALSEARDAAEAASRAKSDFLAMMSHEIRTPMAGMIGMIELLNGTSLNIEQQDLAAVALDSARNLLTVLNNILDFSKLEAGQLKPEAIDFNIRHSVNGVVSLLGPKAAAQGLNLEAALGSDMPLWFRGDPSRIGQILLNLVGNAIKFTERGFVRIVASHHRLEGDAAELRFEIVDTGVGIPAHVLPTLFSPFTQADNSVSRKYGGTGLGLAICKQLCLTMGGNIGVDSEPGHGSRFWFTVRCELGQAPEVTAPALQPQVAPDAANVAILIAEDNAVIRSLITKLLARRGYHADQVTNGREAVEAVQQKAYDLVLMDMQMPEMDGITATKAIRALERPVRDVAIIALTANALVGQRETCLAAGMDGFLTKPIQPDALYDAIVRWAARAEKEIVPA